VVTAYYGKLHEEILSMDDEIILVISAIFWGSILGVTWGLLRLFFTEEKTE